MDFTTLIGLVAAFCTTVSYFPQLKKCWDTGSAGDLSFKMFATLAVGVALWVVYGFLKFDVVIILANAVSLALLFGILYFKLKERHAPPETVESVAMAGLASDEQGDNQRPTKRNPGRFERRNPIASPIARIMLVLDILQ